MTERQKKIMDALTQAKADYIAGVKGAYERCQYWQDELDREKRALGEKVEK